MVTREELLAKGLTVAQVDEILSATEGQDDSSLTALKKALEPKKDEGLFKAEGGEKEGDEADDKEPDGDADDYEEKYMRKHMARYMKENKTACRKAADEAELFDKKMEKAISSIDADSDGAVVEMADLAPVLDAIPESYNALAKAVSALVSKTEIIIAQNENAFALMHKAASVTADTADAMGDYFKSSTGRKGAQTSDMSKALPLAAGLADVKAVYKVLQKAALIDRDEKAAGILEVFESAGQNIRALNPQRQAYVAELMTKGVN